VYHPTPTRASLNTKTPNNIDQIPTKSHTNFTHLQAAIFHKLNLKSSPDPRKVPTIIHQPHKSQNYVKIGFSGLKVNGISVSETPKIGERPYPRQFHPVEICPKSVEIQPSKLVSTPYTPRTTLITTSPIYTKIQFTSSLKVIFRYRYSNLGRAHITELYYVSTQYREKEIEREV